MNVQFDNEIRTSGLSVRLGFLKMHVETKPAGEDLKNFIAETVARVSGNLHISDINKIDTIRETRQAYKMLGKDPSRYRPSAESLIRRIVKSKDLYEINNVVDLLNLISIQSGFSIGGYDFKKVQENILLSRGKSEDDYEGLGRGRLNIENLPVLRDENGAFGCPTSDSHKTAVSESTTDFLMIFFSFGEKSHQKLPEVLEKTVVLYREFIVSNVIDKRIIA